MASAKMRRSESDSRRKNIHKKQDKSGIEDLKTWQELYDEEEGNETCFMQNKGTWSTNDIIVQWFKEHFISRVHVAQAKRQSQGEIVSNKYVVILDGVSTYCLTTSWITELQGHDPDLILLRLPPNMGDQQSRRDVDESNPLVDNTSRENPAAYKLKAVVIEGVINTYKVVPEIQSEKGWTKAGNYVYEDNDKPHDGTLFHQGMSGGISDIIGNLQFIPEAGRKKKQTKEKGTDLDPEDMEESVEEIEAPTQQFSEYGTSDCPDEFVDEETAEGMIVDFISD
ncbi:hypothetical protein PSENEW3_00004861 [Picochlorum sp. SENEW3]|nr:hypothetical protein PSENEW3_00004861 [Picochlorum sp. SENEW3]